MEEIKNFFNNFQNIKIQDSIIIVVFAFVIYKIIAHILYKFENGTNSKLLTSNKGKTYVKFTRNIIRYVFIILVILILLQINGIDVSSILAGVGIFGVIFGLAIQDMLKDVIRGSSILSDEYFSVGDIVKYKDIEGKVLVIGLKTTKICDIKTQNIISIANRNIEQIEVVSKCNYINIPIPYELSVEKAENVVNDIIESIKGNDNVEECTYKSVNELADSYIKYFIEIKCNPIYKLQVKRDANRTILVVFEKHGIAVPYNQIDVHQKN